MTPQPETLSALLVSAGFRKTKVTKHYYLETREIVVDGPRGDAWEFIFKCVETGAERRWGTAERLSFKGMGN